MSEFSHEVRLEGVKEANDDLDDEKTENLPSDGAVALTTNWESLDDDIIDISSLNMDDEETWLQQCTTRRPSFLDLRKWLKNDVDNSSQRNNSMKYDNVVSTSIDTRTFTRPKKKGDKSSTVFTNGASISKFYNDDKEFDRKININWNEEGSRKRDCIPAMLKQSLPVLSPLTVNDQESLEAFLNISQSKGIDSFINMPEPEFYESFINVTRPALSHTVISNNALNHTAGNSTMADSQILTESMMQTSIFNDIDDVGTAHFNDTFVKNFSMHLTSNDLKPETNEELSEAVEDHAKITQENFFVMNRTFDTSSLDTTHLSYTVTTPYELEGLDTTERANFLESISTDCPPSKVSLNSTFIASEIDDELKSHPATQEDVSLNSTYLTDKVIPCAAPDASKKCSPVIDLLKDKCQDVTFKTSYSVPKSVYVPTDCVTANRTFDNPEPAAHSRISNRHENYVSKSIFLSDLPTNYDEFQQKSIINGVKSKSEQTTVINTGVLNFDGNEETSSGRIKSLDKKLKFERIPRKFNSATIRLQKSNLSIAPHKLKTAKSLSKISHHVDIEFDGSQQELNRGDSALSKLHFFKSRNKTDMLHAADSTESIDSTPSVHSAPDVDDRLSTCSDDSQNLFFKRNTEAEQLFKIAQMQEESLNQESTPKSNRKIMENTWIASEKDLPSPILKTSEMGRSISSSTTDGDIKTSSPILSSVESLPSHPANRQAQSVYAEKAAKPVQGAPVSKPATVLQRQNNTENKNANETVRLPSSRPSSAVSGIPRPASRIPAPKFVRTATNIATRIRGQDSNVKKNLPDGS